MPHLFGRGAARFEGLVWSLLTRIDIDIANLWAGTECGHCKSGRLHRSDYPRAAHGLSRDIDADVRRFSFTCSECRRRTMPYSVRFFGRRFRVAPVFLVASVLLERSQTGLAQLGISLRVSLRTLKRWRRWWRESFPETGCWQLLRSKLVPDPEQAPLLVLLSHCRGLSLEFQIVRMLSSFRLLA